MVQRSPTGSAPKTKGTRQPSQESRETVNGPRMSTSHEIATAVDPDVCLAWVPRCSALYSPAASQPRDPPTGPPKTSRRQGIDFAHEKSYGAGLQRRLGHCIVVRLGHVRANQIRDRVRRCNCSRQAQALGALWSDHQVAQVQAPPHPRDRAAELRRPIGLLRAGALLYPRSPPACAPPNRLFAWCPPAAFASRPPPKELPPPTLPSPTTTTSPATDSSFDRNLSVLVVGRCPPADTSRRHTRTGPLSLPCRPSLLPPRLLSSSSHPLVHIAPLPRRRFWPLFSLLLRCETLRPSVAAMSRQPRNQGQSGPTATTRQNEYFVPRDGIDREVISADICRYLGNDALVRPGHYEELDYSEPYPLRHLLLLAANLPLAEHLLSLTSLQAMIEDLKADSARWDNERRAQTSRNTSGGIHTSRDASGFPARPSSNSPVVQYRYSETHQSRQHHGPTEAPFQADPYRDPGYENRYPGTGAPGYTGASGAYPPPQQQQQQQYAATSGGAYAGGYQPTQQSPGPDPRFSSAQGGSMMRPGYQPSQDPPYIGTGANLPHSGFAQSNDPYNSRLGASAAAPQQPVYATAPPQQPTYPASSSPYQPFPGQAPAGAGQPYPAMQPHDPFYGRASPAGQAPQQQTQGYSNQGQQYEEAPPSRSSATPATAPTPPAGSSNRRSDRDSDRHHRPPRR
ncbi:hypothetical protein PCL_12361 [Purpureocillium lilacinum]|uniref:Uncharacterized protein n=1 Tax=Purpureocillium lilacinum TaxID=33203 RepID=A0A2U3E907_PURLI|nr:hypothetical protein PCL_12361 [Purpureocillium lilacinum]